MSFLGSKLLSGRTNMIRFLNSVSFTRTGSHVLGRRDGEGAAVEI